MSDGRLPPPTDLIELGVVRGAYGVHGWLRISPYSADADVLWSCRRWWLRRHDAVTEIAVTGLRRHMDLLLAKWPDCETPEAAEALKSATVAVARSEFPPLPEGSFYWVDLVGVQVVNRAGESIGIVRGLSNNGAQDLLDVIDGDVKRLIPIVDAYVDQIDLGARTITVDWQRDW